MGMGQISKLRGKLTVEIFARDCTKPGKDNASFRDGFDKDYGDGIILTCFKICFSEYFENYNDINLSGAEIDNDSLPSLTQNMFRVVRYQNLFNKNKMLKLLITMR